MDSLAGRAFTFSGLFFASMLVYAAGPFVVDDQIISDPAISMFDPEIDTINNRVAWKDSVGNLWLADIDPVTAVMTPVSGQGQLIDSGLASINDALQGPEWCHGNDGIEIIYTKDDGTLLKLATSRQKPDGTWVSRLLYGGDNRYGAKATPAWYNTGPSRAVYLGLDGQGDLYTWWRAVKYPRSEVKIPQPTVKHASFIDGENNLLLTTIKAGETTRQVASMPLTRTATVPVQLTTDAGDKTHPSKLFAPDFGEMIITTLIDNASVGIYQEVAGQWIQTRIFQLPSANPEYSALRPFVFNNKTYVAIIATESGGGGISQTFSEVWIAGLDPNEPFFRQVSDPNTLEIRKDPKVYVTSSGPIILYSEKNSVFNTWVWRRAETGLYPNFVVDDQVISDPAVSLIDPEVDQVGNRIAWQNLLGELWVADLDPVTGDLTPTNGKGELVDIDLVPLQVTLNGPEWAYGMNDTRIVYTKSLATGFNLASAQKDQFGVWQTQSLANSFLSLTPLGTPSSNTSAPRTSYFSYDTGSGDLFLGWRDIDDPTTEGFLFDSSVASGRWVEDQPLIVTTINLGGFKQVVTYDTSSDVLSQLTFEPSHKFLPYMWMGPEFGEILMMTMLDTEAVGIYRQDVSGWNLIHTISLPTSKPFVHSPEPFVYGGKSYILLVAADQLGSGGSFFGTPVGPTEIWIAGIDAAQPFFRRIDDPLYEANRLDPEIYVIADDAVALYSEKDASTGHYLLKRAKTGLGTNPN
jgi:hypothetical protein